MKEINEEILEAWLELTASINNERIVNEMPFNEMLIYRILYQNQDKDISATDLCAFTKMQKSQMNRTLNSMEEKGMICRERSLIDKRLIHVTLNKEQINIYEKEHTRILKIVDTLVQRIGMENAHKTLELFRLIAHIAKEEIQ